MSRRLTRSGWRILLPVAAVAVAAASLSLGSAFGASNTITDGLLRATNIPFSCERASTVSGFGFVTYKQNGSLLSVKFKLTNVPANTEFGVELVQCQSDSELNFGQDVESVISDSKGVATGSFSVRLLPGADHYYICIDHGRAEWGTEPEPVF